MKKIILLVVMLVSTFAAAQVKAVVEKTTTGHSATLSWIASDTGSTVTGYNVYRGLSVGGENYTTPINSSLVTTDSYVDTTVVASTTYYYTIESYCPTCNPTLSNPSVEVKASIPGNQPDPPTGVTATSN